MTCHVRPRHTRFHHNWIHNLNDDALIVDTEGTSDLEVSQNVIMRCLGGHRLRPATTRVGERKVHRNLIDLRVQPPGYGRDHAATSSTRTMRTRMGACSASASSTRATLRMDALDLFHNTCLVANQAGQAGIQHYANSDGERPAVRSTTSSCDVDPSPDRPSAYATAFLPKPTFQGPTDGNCYFQLAGEQNPLLRHSRLRLAGLPAPRSIRSKVSPPTDRASGKPRATRSPNTHLERQQGLVPAGLRTEQHRRRPSVPADRSRRRPPVRRRSPSPGRQPRPREGPRTCLTRPSGSTIRWHHSPDHRTSAATSSTNPASMSASTDADSSRSRQTLDGS